MSFDSNVFSMFLYGTKLVLMHYLLFNNSEETTDEAVMLCSIHSKD